MSAFVQNCLVLRNNTREIVTIITGMSDAKSLEASRFALMSMKTSFSLLVGVLMVILLSGCDQGKKPTQNAVELDQAMAGIIKSGTSEMPTRHSLPESKTLSTTNAIAAK